MDKVHGRTEILQEGPENMGKREPFVSKTERDYLLVTKEDLLYARERVLNGTDVAIEGALTMFPPIPGSSAPDEYAWWGHKLATNEKLFPLPLTEAERVRFDSLLNPSQEREWQPRPAKTSPLRRDNEGRTGFRGPYADGNDI